MMPMPPGKFGTPSTGMRSGGRQSPYLALLQDPAFLSQLQPPNPHRLPPGHAGIGAPYRSGTMFDWESLINDLYNPRQPRNIGIA